MVENWQQEYYPLTQVMMLPAAVLQPVSKVAQTHDLVFGAAPRTDSSDASLHTPRLLRSTATYSSRRDQCQL